MTSPRLALDSLRAVVDRFAGCRVAVLGDLMLDRYFWGEVERISPEAPVPIVAVQRETFSLGGAGNVAANLAALGAAPALVGVVGDDAEGRRLATELTRRGIDVAGVVADLPRPTTVKTRVIAHQQQVVRIDAESREDVTGAALTRLEDALDAALRGARALVVSDYGKGVITGRVLEFALERARREKLEVCVDPKESHADAYRGVSVITPNAHEAGLMAGQRIRDQASLLEVGWGLRERLDARAVLVTRGAQGMSLFERGRDHLHLPAEAREVFDVTGAGDTVVSVFALALAAGADYPAAAHLSNHAAGLVIREVGTATCSAPALLASLGGNGLKRAAGAEDAARLAQAWRTRGLRVVFTNGVFDLLHAGHVEYLRAARALGDALVVGVNSDDSVRRLKGPARPLVPESERAEVLAALECVDLVVSFTEDTPLALIQALAPDVLVKGADYAESEIVGADFVRANGGRVERIPLRQGLSTSELVRRASEGKAALR